ncbi:hypothetical protein TIFTF001_056260, partial [Ficus carica]
MRLGVVVEVGAISASEKRERRAGIIGDEGHHRRWRMSPK